MSCPEETDKLTEYILKHSSGPRDGDGACDTAVRLLRERDDEIHDLRWTVGRLGTELERFGVTLAQALDGDVDLCLPENRALPPSKALALLREEVMGWVADLRDRVRKLEDQTDEWAHSELSDAEVAKIREERASGTEGA